jgi:hypothetical protein
MLCNLHLKAREMSSIRRGSFALWRIAAVALMFAIHFPSAKAQSAQAQDNDLAGRRGSAGASPNASFIVTVLPGARLAGSGELRFFGFKIYDAQLWLSASSASQPGNDASKLLEQAFALDLRYARNLKGEEIAERSLDEMRRLGFGVNAQHERWLVEMKKIFPNVARGDHITGLFQPGGATRFFLNEKLLGRIEDVDFGIAFFNIWFDPRTRAPALRDSLTKAAN